MYYLLEHDAGFDEHTLGFPSIWTCQAICYVTDLGLFGYHNYGGNEPSQFAARANLFGDFVDKSLKPRGYHLYGCSFIKDHRYGDRAKEWKQELKAFAKRLNFAGPISGYDLGTSLNPAKSAYVEYRMVGSLAYIFAQEYDKTNLVNRPTTPNDTNIHRTQGKNQPQQLISSLSRNKLVRVYPQKL